MLSTLFLSASLSLSSASLSSLSSASLSSSSSSEGRTNFAKDDPKLKVLAIFQHCNSRNQLIRQFLIEYELNWSFCFHKYFILSLNTIESLQ